MSEKEKNKDKDIPEVISARNQRKILMEELKKLFEEQKKLEKKGSE